ncbi:unnamed protein product [Protopolystoma xenopodis]|uniref:Uncharacterized protein n=1 Tax=Protopolystoma xenopodis TaxID=117903 RepID=A0A448X5N9_9PLAT|nr:unnamed protein product [Protopolystoma xenopodis]
MSSIRLSLVIPRRFFRLTFAYSKQEDYGLGFTRSIYCKPKIIDYVSEDGSKVKLYSGLVDNSVQPLTVYMREIYLNITYKADFSLPAIEKRILKRIKEKNRQRQKISDDDFKKYGLDLAVAHMICRIGGRVQFAGSDYWYQAIKDVPADLPISTGQIKLETIDASCTSISYEGFDHLCNYKLNSLMYCFVIHARHLQLVWFIDY